VLLFLLAAPVYTVLLAAQFEPDVTNGDLAYVAIELALIMIEWFADQQQWDFHGAKKEYHDSSKIREGYGKADLDRGFITSGLWAYSRHPNFAAEQSIWFILYQWSCFVSKTLYSSLATGPVFLVMLFQGSTWLTELITAGKYPEYRQYQRKVGMFVPTTTTPYKTAVAGPRIIRTSELAKKQKQK